MKKLLLISILCLLIGYLISLNQNQLKVEYVAIGSEETKSLEIASFDATTKPKNIILILKTGLKRDFRILKWFKKSSKFLIFEITLTS